MVTRVIVSAIALGFVCLLVIGTVVGAAQAAELKVPDILNSLYGIGKWSEYSGPDEVWFNLNGHSEAVARYAGFTQNFGYLMDTDSDGLFSDEAFVSLFNVTGSGFLNSDSYRTYLPKGPFNFIWADKASGSPLWTSIPNPNDHMKTFYIPGEGKYVIAWEDLNLGDADYNDLVVEVYAVTPVPEPGTLLLLGCGLIGLGGMGLYRRRRS